MRLSIGVPAYNQGSFLRETLTSILDQEVPFDEIVVSDNHSTDSTPDVIAAVQAEHPGRVRLVRPPQHLTMAGNWNFTVAQMSGDWFSLLSSDDLTFPNFVRSVQTAAASSPNAVLVRGAWRNIGLKGETLQDRHLLSVSAVTRPPKTLFEQRYGPKGSFAAFALRRDIWERVGGFPENVTLVGDWGMWLLSGALGDIVYTDDLISKYRMGHQTETTRKRHHIHMREMFTVYSEILPRATELAGLGKPPWIAAASRRNFREFVIGTSQDFGPNDRAQLVEAFRPWAEATAQQALLRRFERGDVLRHTDPMRALRGALRPLVAALRSSRTGARS